MCTPFLSTSSLQIPPDWQVVPLVVMCVRVLSLLTFFWHPPPSRTRIFSLVTHVLWCVTSFPMEWKVSVGKHDSWWDGPCKLPCLARVSPVVQWLMLQGTAADQNDQEPSAWVVTTKWRTQGRRKGKSEEGGFKIHLVASEGRGVKGHSEPRLFVLG